MTHYNVRDAKWQAQQVRNKFKRNVSTMEYSAYYRTESAEEVIRLINKDYDTSLNAFFTLIENNTFTQNGYREICKVPGQLRVMRGLALEWLARRDANN